MAPALDAVATCSDVLGSAAVDVRLSVAYADANDAPRRQGLRLYLAVDASGSMMGAPIEEAKAAVKALLESALPLGLAACHLVVFENMVRLSTDLLKLPEDKRVETVRAEPCDAAHAGVALPPSPC